MAVENVLDRSLANHRLLGTVNKGANLAGNVLARKGGGGGWGALRLAKSDGRIAAPDTCLTEAWKRLTTERKVETRGLAENSPTAQFLERLDTGLLSVRVFQTSPRGIVGALTSGSM